MAQYVHCRGARRRGDRLERPAERSAARKRDDERDAALRHAHSRTSGREWILVIFERTQEDAEYGGVCKAEGGSKRLAVGHTRACDKLDAVMHERELPGLPIADVLRYVSTLRFRDANRFCRGAHD